MYQGIFKKQEYLLRIKKKNEFKFSWLYNRRKKKRKKKEFENIHRCPKKKEKKQNIKNKQKIPSVKNLINKEKYIKFVISTLSHTYITI